MDDTLLVAEVTEIRGTKIRARVHSDKNEAYLFYHGKLVRNVSVGGYVKIPCGFSQVIGTIEGEYQQERNPNLTDYSKRTTQGSSFDRFIEISVFGVLNSGKFDRGVTILPLIDSNVYVLAPDELELISSDLKPGENSFRIGELAGNSGVSVAVSANALFASHVGVFGNTGSGKSNTLSRLYSDCFDKIGTPLLERGCKSKFVFIDFNGEYTGADVLTPHKKTFCVNTGTIAGGDKILVPEDFYFDLDMWSILTQATDKTQRPFLRRCIRMAKNIRSAGIPANYLDTIVRNFLRDYCGKPSVFQEQREDFSRTFAYLIDRNNLSTSEDAIDAAINDIEVFVRPPGAVLRKGNAYGDAPDDMINSIFADFLALNLDYSSLCNDISSLLEFVCRFQYLQQWRNGSIVREHISFWLPRMSQQLAESKKIYQPITEELLSIDTPAVSVYSLLNVNQEQKKLIPLVIAKYYYREQKTRGHNDRDTSVHLVIDEAHNILSYSSQRESESWRDYRLETFEEIVKEGRKFGMFLTVCSQRPSDISVTVISQMHNYFIHRLVNDEDLRAIGKAVAFIDRANESMIPVLPQGTCIVSGIAMPYPTRVHVQQLPDNRQPKSSDRDLTSAWNAEVFRE